MTIFEWVRKIYGNFGVTAVCAELRSTPAVSDGLSFGAYSRLQDACPAVVSETLMCTCANSSNTVVIHQQCRKAIVEPRGCSGKHTVL